MEPKIVIKNGLRYVLPYYSRRSSHIKGRWMGKTLETVLIDEFNMSSSSATEKVNHFEFEVIRAPPGSEARQLTVAEILNEKLKPGDILVSKSHKHEPPVTANSQSIPIIFESDDLLVVDKPSGVPVHPTGQYYYNSLTKILESDGFDDLKPAYRLDRPTSGLLVFSRNTQAAGDIQKKIKEHFISKWYFAKVSGKFPDIVNHSSDIFTVELKRHFKAAFSIPKNAQSNFTLYKYDSNKDESIVLCKPLTGRTHQLRIHLARLGFPIVNDPFFNMNNTNFPKRTKFIIDTEDWQKISNLQEYYDMFVQEEEQNRKTRLLDKVCSECSSVIWKDPDLSGLELYLHAWKYENLTTTALQTKLPSWVGEMATN